MAQLQYNPKDIYHENILYTEDAYFILECFYCINHTKNYAIQDIQAS